MQILPVLQVTPTESELPVVQAFLKSDDYTAYLEDAQVCVQIWPTFGVDVTGGYYYINFGCNVCKCCRGRYVSYQGALSVEERLRQVREAVRLEKEAHAKMSQEFEELKRVLAGMSAGTPTVGRASDRKLPSVPSMGIVPVHTNDSDTPEASVSVEGGTSATHQPTEAESASPIAKRVRNDPRTRHSSMLQTSPYVNPVTHIYEQESVEDVLCVNQLKTLGL